MPYENPQTEVNDFALAAIQFCAALDWQNKLMEVKWLLIFLFDLCK